MNGSEKHHSAGPVRIHGIRVRHADTSARSFSLNQGRHSSKHLSIKPPDEDVNEEFPLGLTTGRIESQWHTRTRTGKVPQLVRKEPEPFVEIHPDDAVENDIQDGEWVYLVGRRGRCYAKARVTEAIRRGLLFTPFHWGDLFHAETNANYVTNPAFDPVSKQPELKFCAVRIEAENS